jgi:hypothetical protein
MLFNMSCNQILYRNQSIIMLGNQIDNIDNVNVGVNFIGLFESNAWHYKILRWWPRIWHAICQFKTFKFTYWTCWDLN